LPNFPDRESFLIRLLFHPGTGRAASLFWSTASAVPVLTKLIATR
jgi:hypothetical protein